MAHSPPRTDQSGTDSDGHRPLDFSTYLISLGASALVQLGEAPDPAGGTSRDVAGARQTIDLLGILEAKTAGNLEPSEARLLKHLLNDLRLRFSASHR